MKEKKQKCGKAPAVELAMLESLKESRAKTSYLSRIPKEQMWQKKVRKELAEQGFGTFRRKEPKVKRVPL